MDQTSIHAALAELQPSLASDGFELLLNGIDADGTVEVALAATEGACLECLVPDEVLVSILEGSIQEKSSSAVSVRLVKTGAFRSEAS